MKKQMIIAALCATLFTAGLSATVYYSTSENYNNVLTASDEFSSLEKNLPVFNSVKLKGICHVTIKSGTQNRIEVRGPKNFVENFAYSVDSNKTLTVKMNKNYAYSTEKGKKDFLNVTIYMPKLIKLEKDNLGDVEVANDVKVEDLWVVNSSMTALTLGDIKCNTACIALTSGGSINMGNVEVKTQVSCKNTSMGNIKLGNISGTELKMKLSSGGNITTGNINVKGHVECINSSMGKMRMNDVTCESLNMDLSSGGNIMANDIVATGDVNCECSSMGDIKVNSIKSNSNCDVRLSSGGDFIAEKIIADKLNCSSSSMGEIKIRIADVKKFSQNSGSGRIKINY